MVGYGERLAVNAVQIVADGGETASCETASCDERAPEGAAAAPSGWRNDSRIANSWRGLETIAALPTQALAFSAALVGTLLAQAHVEIFQVQVAEGIGALLPLCRDKSFFARWRVTGARELFEPVDALCESPAAAKQLARALACQSRPLVLDRLPDNSVLLPELKQAMKGRGWLSVRPAVPFPTIALDENWKNPESCFNSRRRSDFRRAARRAEQFGNVTYEVHSPRPDELDALFDEAIRVELSGWKKDAGTAIASDHAKEQFFRDYFRACCDAGQFRIAFMRIDGRAVAMQMAVEWADRYWLFKIGYDEAFGKCSPGTLLMLHTLGYAAQRGLRAYELLGNVESWIADFWTRDQHACVRVRSYPYSVRGMAALVADTATWLCKRLPGRKTQ